MILVDTSVWVDHLSANDETLAELLEAGRVLVHPFVVGELALGSLPRREAILSELQMLPRATVAADNEVLLLIERSPLFNIGIGYVDAHLLASARLTAGASLWTRDKRLAGVATRLGVAWGEGGEH